MGATQSHHSCNGDGPASGLDASYRLPLKESLASPSPTRDTYAKDARRTCTLTSSTLLTLDSAPYNSSDESYDIESAPSRDEAPGDCWAGADEARGDCWAGPLLAHIIAFVSPSKTPALAYNTSFDSTLANTQALSTAATTICKYIKGTVDTQDKNASQLDAGGASNPWQSPTSVNNFPSLSGGDERLQLRLETLPLPLTEEPQSQPSISDLPRKRLHFDDLQAPCEQQKSDRECDPLQRLLDEASKYEAESDLDAAIARLEEFLHQSAPLACLRSRAASLHKLGILQWKCGRYFFAEHALLDSIHIYRRLLEDAFECEAEEKEGSQVSLELAHALVSAGRVYLSKCEIEAAKQCFDESVGHLPSTASPRSGTAPTPARIFSQACVGAGRVLACQGKWKASLRRYKRALKTQLGPAAGLYIEREDIPALSVHEARVPLEDVAETLSHMGRHYELQNDASLAQECHEKSLAIYKSVLDPHAVDIGYACSNFGQLYLRFGQIPEAEGAFKKAYNIFSLRLGADHRNTIDTLLSLGQLHASQRRHQRALALFKRVLRAEPSGHLLASTLHSIAASYEKTFRLDKALKYYQREVTVLDTITPSCHLSRARLLHHMGNIAMQIVDGDGEYTCLERAADWLEEAAEIYYTQGSCCDQLETSIEETRLRMRRKAEMHIMHAYSS